MAEYEVMRKENKKSLINQVIIYAPPFFPIPAKGYGGTERVVDGIVKTFHAHAMVGTIPFSYELWAPGDSYQDKTGVEKPILLPTTPESLGVSKPFEAQALMMADMHRIRRILRDNPNAAAHIHIEDLHIPVLGQDINMAAQTLTTIHNPVKPWYRDYKHMPLVAISEAQKNILGIHDFDFVRVVHNGIDGNLFKPNYEIGPDSPLTFIGRFSPDKNPGDAVDIARRAGVPIQLAGPIDPQNPDCHAAVMQACERHSSVSYVGSVTDEFNQALGQSAKSAFLGASRAMLFPIGWREPFGLVIAEANACGTPVIAYDHPGSAVSELIQNGVNGFKVKNAAEAAEAVKKIGHIDRRGVRAHFDKHYTASVMGEKYERILSDDLPAYRRSLRQLVMA